MAALSDEFLDMLVDDKVQSRLNCARIGCRKPSVETLPTIMPVNCPHALVDRHKLVWSEGER